MKYVFTRYCQAWRMWNSWLIATGRPEIEFEQFIEAGFELIDNKHDGRDGIVVGEDGLLSVEIGEDRIWMRFNGKPRYTWWPFIVSYGNLEPHECNSKCHTDIWPRLQSPTLDLNEGTGRDTSPEYGIIQQSRFIRRHPFWLETGLGRT